MRNAGTSRDSSKVVVHFELSIRSMSNASRQDLLHQSVETCRQFILLDAADRDPRCDTLNMGIVHVGPFELFLRDDRFAAPR